MSNPLVPHHEKLGGQLDSEKYPISYSDPSDEYWAVKKAAGIADVTNLGRLMITGKDRISFLNGLLTNDISKVKEGGGQHSALLTPKARVLADLHLYVQTGAVSVDTGDSPASKVKDDLDRFVITEDVQIRNATSELVQLTVQGPRAGQFIKETLKVGVELLKALDHKNLGPSTIICRDRTGQGGFDIVLPNQEAEAVWQGFLLKAGEMDVKPVGSMAMDILRIEGGYPKYGIDVSEETIVLEAGFKDAISFTKGCYMGQEVVARATHIGRVNKQLVKFEVDTNDPPPMRSKLRADNIEVGFITSAAFSPGSGKVVALGYAIRDHAKEGAKLTLDSLKQQLPVTVTRIL